MLLEQLPGKRLVRFLQWVLEPPLDCKLSQGQELGPLISLQVQPDKTRGLFDHYL